VRQAAGRYRGGVAVDPELAETVAAAVLAHPGVARLSGGPFGTVASYLPGRRVVGVRLPPDPADPVEIVVVAHLGVGLPHLAQELGAAVAGVLGPVTVDVTVADVETGAPHPARP